MPDFPHVALIIETSKQYGRELLLGIGRYLQAHGPWSVFLDEREESDREPRWLDDWDGDGIITRSADPSGSRLARQRGIPAVNLSYHRDLDPDLPMPCINCDHPRTGAMVAEYFARRGFRRFAYCHVRGATWSEDRRDAFIAAAQKAGGTAEVFDASPRSERRGAHWEREQDQLAAWVQSLPKPCGIMAAYDVLGARVIDACRRVGVRVPESVAIVGVDNDPLFCSVSWPPLSSVDQNVQRIGFEAARLLAAMMKGEAPGAGREPILIPPKELVTRTSSDILAFHDSNIAAALQFIRDHAGRPITVDEVARRAGLSRRELERRFQRLLETSPYKEIQRARIKRVRNLLIHTDDTLESISETLGFSEAANMANLFKKEMGMPPGEYRKSRGN
ncbi:MAG: DNA-binding transcriptional regulator [Verrucomicrobiales bacterium]